MNDDIPSILEHVYSRSPITDAVAIVHGYGCKLRIVHGQLVITDGIGRHQRERRWPKANRTLQRIVITGQDGYVTLEALQWAAEHDITVAMLDHDSGITAHYATAQRVTDAKLTRRQVLATDDGTGLEVVRAQLAAKVNGQGDVLMKCLSDDRTAARLYGHAERMQDAHTLAELNDLERFAAKDYWFAWTGKVTVPFDRKSMARIPSNWLMFERRKLSASKGNTHRHATEPISAMLNYAYALGYTEARTACIAHGLNPALGFNHADKLGRDSLALDVLEVIRPEIDSYILGLAGFGSEPRTFTYRDFAEPYGDFPPGTVRVAAPLTHEIAEASYTWETTALEAAATVRRILTSTTGKPVGVKSLSLANQKVDFIRANVDVNTILPDAAWERIQALLPQQSPHSSGASASHVASQRSGAISNRTVLAALIYLRRHNRPLAYVPDGFGISRRTLHERKLRWARSGHWPEIEREIEEIAQRNL